MAGRVKSAVLKWLGVRQPGETLYSDYAQSESGMMVSGDMAMRLSTVHACVRVLSEDIAALPLHVYTRGADGSKERVRKHPLYTLLHDKPNPEMTAISFKEAMMVNLLLTGNAYAFIEYDRAGRVLALWPLLSGEVTPRRTSGGEIVYQVNGMQLRTDDVLHIPGLSYDGLLGLSPIAYARESIGLASAAERFGATLFKNGTHIGGVISVKGELSDPAYQRVKEQFSAMYRGLQNAHGVPVLEDGAEFKSVGISPEDAQFLETRKFQRSEIAAIYRVPPHLIGDLDKATFSNIEHQDLAYLQRALLPWLVRWEQAMQTKLLLEREQSSMFIEFDTANFMRGDTQSRMRAYATAIQNGIMTPNEARARENLNPIEGGDVILLPLNMQAAGTQTAPGDAASQGMMRSFAADGERHAVSVAKSAELRGKKQENALETAISAWLKAQAGDILRIARDVLGVRARSDSPVSKLLDSINRYYADTAEYIPEDVQSAIEQVASAAFAKVKRDCPASDVPQAWIEGFMKRYYAEMSERLASANGRELKNIITAAKDDPDILERLTERLSGWGDDRAQTMAENERYMATNNALVAGYRQAGYESIWQASGKCCKACQALNGQVVSTLRPPLHKGCSCTVSRGEKVYKSLQSAKEPDKMTTDDEIRKWIASDDCNKQIRQGQQRKHRVGTHECEQYCELLKKRAQYGPSRIELIDDELNALIAKYAGTGRISYNEHGHWRCSEVIQTDTIVGTVVNNLTGFEEKTTMAKIHYSGEGVHVVPSYPNKEE